jgi:hypothetical protein
MTNQRLAVLYEHPDWFKPLFAALNRRSIIYVPLYAEELSYDPAVRSFPYPLVLNRMSPSFEDLGCVVDNAAISGLMHTALVW